MKIKAIFFICLLAFVMWGHGETKDPYYYEIIATPNKSLNFNIYLFHHQYRWVESNSGNYSTLSMVIKNDGNAPPLSWKAPCGWAPRMISAPASCPRY